MTCLEACLAGLRRLDEKGWDGLEVDFSNNRVVIGQGTLFDRERGWTRCFWPQGAVVHVLSWDDETETK